MQYLIRRARRQPELRGLWDGPAWSDADVARLEYFHPASTAHHPRTQVKLLHDDAGIYVHFRVDDRYVRCTRTRHQQMVCKDSCVEWFVSPFADATKGYFN